MKLTHNEEIELESGKVVEVSITLNIIYDAHYGADADGNRGIPTRILDDYDFVCNSTLTNEEFAELTKKVEKQIQAWADDCCLISEER